MTKLKLVKLVLLGVLSTSLIILSTFILSDNDQGSGYRLEGKYKLIENGESNNIAYVYKLNYNDTAIDIVTKNQIDNEQLNSGWRSNQIVTIATKDQFNSNNLLIYEDFLVYFEDSNNIYINNLSEGTAKKLDIAEEDARIINIAQEDSKLILLMNLVDDEDNQKINLIERAVNIQTMDYKDSLISFELNEKLPNNLINNLTGSTISGQFKINEKNISGRALDVWEFSTDFTQEPIVYSASNGDYIVSDIKMNELGVITFNGNYRPVFKEAPEYWILGN